MLSKEADLGFPKRKELTPKGRNSRLLIKGSKFYPVREVMF